MPLLNWCLSSTTDTNPRQRKRSMGSGQVMLGSSGLPFPLPPPPSCPPPPNLPLPPLPVDVFGDWGASPPCTARSPLGLAVTLSVLHEVEEEEAEEEIWFGCSPSLLTPISPDRQDGFPFCRSSANSSSAESRQTLSESPAVLGPAPAGIECRPRPLATGSGAPGAAGGTTRLTSASTTLPYVNSPQGNSVISHHPASPFEPLPKSGPGPGLGLSGKVGGTGCSPPSAAQMPSSPPRMQTTGASTADHPPMYEEAWDLKMSRLGLDMSRLSTAPVSSLLVRPIQTQSQIQVQAPASAPPPQPAVPPAVPPHRGSLTGAPDHPHASTRTGGAPIEYDYAYNGSWSMGVQMNLSLNLHQSSTSNNTEEHSTEQPGPPTQPAPTEQPISPTPSNLTPPLPSVPVACPPLIKSHSSDVVCLASSSSTSVSAGTVSATTAAAATSTGAIVPCPPPGDTDSLSTTDSYDEPWDVRHGRVISELTSTRLIDPPVLPPSQPARPSQPVSSSQQQASDPSASSRHRSRSGTTTTTASYDPQLSSTTTAPVVASTGELILIVDRSLPLDEQPWFHPSLSRSGAEDLLAIHREGSFLVRRSETNRHDYSLTIKHQMDFLHMKISRNNRGQYILGQYSQPYPSIPHMISHYSRTLVPVRGADSVTLRHPICRQLQMLPHVKA